MSLRESGGLPSARGTRQSQKNPRQRVCRVSTLGKRHSANFSQQTDFASVFCRALGKDFAECRKNTRQRFTLGKIKMRKNPKIIAKKPEFFSGEATTGQRAPAYIEVAAFFAQNPRLTRPTGFELMISP